MTSLFLGDFGHGLIAAEAALAEAIRSLGAVDPIVVSATPAYTERCVPGITCIAPDDPLPRAVSQVVLAGPIFRRDRTLALVEAFSAAKAAGATPRLHNLSLPPGLEPAETAGIAVEFADATGSLRDHTSLLVLMRRRLPWFPDFACFSERTLGHDDSLSALLPEGPAPLGLMFDGTPLMLDCLEDNPAAFAAVMGSPGSGPLLPIPDTAPGLTGIVMGDAVLASRRAMRAARPGEAALLPALLDTRWWLENATPAGLAGLVRRCSALVTTTDFGVVLAAAAGIPCHIIGYSMDDPATRAGGTLAGALAPGSSFIVLPPRK
ncbi:hypothetical protein C8P66_11499 [Humitalea rosea]|uniref:Polysaccharide pyruvyl transferase n=1 Tax=Humitalea rosea TaxID=990373 RepID=A0A2W7IEC3_9PROT|nr:hypothetical protein [Humitalea rosea]PZW44809.1 hypothetical protein C8P66_11499 [Humitalea rosea]